MPCGHLTVCDACGEYLMNAKKIECILCKIKCDDIYHTVEAVKRQELESDFYYNVKTV
jgi:hypothetical protein